MDGNARWIGLVTLSGAASLALEAVWLRRLSLLLGGSAVASAVTVAAFMGGLALGAALSRRVPGPAPRAYALLEASAAAWAVAFPVLLAAGEALVVRAPVARWLVAAALLVPPAAAFGATWPLLARASGGRTGALLYAANTAGAVAGVLASTFVLLPTLGVRGTELVAATVGALAAAAAVGAPPPPVGADPVGQDTAGPGTFAAVALAGFAAIGLEVTWMRLAAVALGATVQTVGLVLATFLATVAAGALVGRSFPRDPGAGLALGGALLGGLALAGGVAWGAVPYGVAALYRAGGPDALLPGSAVLAALAMGGAPCASGLVFACAVRCLGPGTDRAGALYAANAAGSVLGALLGGLVAVPLLEARGALWLFAAAAAAGGVAGGRRAWPLAVLLLAPFVPAWDERLFAVGVHLRISDFAEPTAAAVRSFADEGWELLLYDQGPTGAVAVGRSTRTGNVWLSINGKVDASTGDDMPTQRLSGELPVLLAERPRDALVVGLASGVTAGAVLADPRVERLVVLEIEPAVVRAEPFFRHVNGRPLDDPRTTLVLGDARAWLLRTERRFDVIVSEPSNPWITGVSSLFTLEYWELLRGRLREGGVVCQWLQLYGMGTDELRGLLRTFRAVFPDARLFETVEGSDVLLVGGGTVGGVLPLAPLLDAEGVRRAAGRGWLNTDDRPRVEWQAPYWLHRDTAGDNAALLRAFTER